MGVGIATAILLAQKGHNIRLLDLKKRSKEEEYSALVRAKDEIGANLDLLRDLGLVGAEPASLLDNVSLHREPECLQDTHLVFEALPETVDAKRPFFGLADEYLPADGIIASATSSFDLGLFRELSSRPERVVTAHWLNPAFLIPLVEVAKAEWTDTAAVDYVVEFLRSIGKTALAIKDSPGFIVPRIQTAAMNEAVRIFEDGVASPADIDTAIKAGYGFRLGVFGIIEFIDLGGVDILAHAGAFLHERLGGAQYDPPQSVKDKMAAGEVGPRSGRGYYDFAGVDTAALFRDRYQAFVELLRLYGESSHLSFLGGIGTPDK
jgi:3-hydroxybutyryl-CoA dehydrogenase